MREILKKLCKYKYVEIVVGSVCADHIFMCEYPSGFECASLWDIRALMIYDLYLNQGCTGIERFGHEAIMS